MVARAEIEKDIMFFFRDVWYNEKPVAGFYGKCLQRNPADCSLGGINMLTLTRAKELNAEMVTDPHLIVHSTNVMAAMEAMARHFGADPEHWKAVGYLHD